MKNLLRLSLLFAFPLFLHSQDYFEPLSGPGDVNVATLLKDKDNAIYIKAFGVAASYEKSTDNGATWEPVLINDSTEANKLYFDDFNNAYGIDHNGTVYKSTDNGIVWVPVFSHETQSHWDMSVSPTGILYLHGNYELYKSQNNGGTWEPIDSIRFNPNIGFHTDGEMYAASSTNAIKSTDGGYNWEEIYSAPFYSQLFYAHVSTQGNIFLAEVNGQQLFPVTTYLVSWDDGDNFDTLYIPFTGFGYLATNDSGDIFIETSIGIFMSKDNGNSWTDISSGIEDPSKINYIYIDDDQYIYLGMRKDVLYKSILPSNEIITPVFERKKIINSKAYPNPFHNSFIIEIENTFSQPLLFELKGQHGRKIIEKEFTESMFEINGSNLPCGLYFYFIFSNGKIISTGKIIAQ
ncbi:MAG TPA: T9SS type A sorting domain-containing protein [Bacteroidetes bacterium]|nr:T9SS type A sorting domain-containing protein [Bacteroidota bacterium]